MIEPNRRERELAECYSSCRDDANVLAVALANYREELLKPFVELQRDADAVHDKLAAKLLDDVIRMSRGEP